MLSLISAEMLKVRKRRATWIMFAIFLTFIAFMVVGIRPIVLGEEGRDSVEFQALNEAIRFPMGFAVVLLFVSQMGRWNLIVFAALVVAMKGDLLAVRRPRRKPVPAVVVGELGHPGPISVHHKDLVSAVPVAMKGDLAVLTPTAAPGQQHASQQHPNEPSHTPQSATFP